MRPPRLPFGLLALFVLLLLSLAAEPTLAQDDPFRLWSRQQVGDPADDPPYVLELWSETTRQAIDVDSATRFRFEITWRSDERPVVPGPDLQVFTFRCAAPEGEGILCDPVVRERTETGRVLQDAVDGRTDGVYPWSPDRSVVFDETGEWHIQVGILPGPSNHTARYVLPVQDLPSGPPELINLFEILFGIQGGILVRILVFLLWALIFFLVGRGLTRLARRTVLSPSRVDPTVGRLAIRLFSAVWTIVAIAFTLWIVWRVNFWAGLTALGLLSVALGFGMQNTVANLMGGINLAADKPFVIGDRIMVGETWGDVQEIGLRSTKILTTRKEVVIIPNKLLDEREIWNYTRDHQELRLDIDAGISYDSDRRLAEALMIQAAREHPAILDYPRPRVLLMGFGDSSVDLQLRCWLQAAKDARIVASDLRKATKDKFDDNGVEIPFPYRTLVNKTDLAAPRRADPAELQALSATASRLPKMLYATSGPPQIHSIADFVGKIAKELDMALVVLYVTKETTRRNRAEEYRVFSAFQDAAAHHTIPLKRIHSKGDVVARIKETIREEEIDLVAIGAHRYAIIPSPRKVADFTKEIRDSIHIPVLIVPRSLEISTRTLNHYRNLVEDRHLSKERKRRGIVSDREAEPETRRGEAVGTGLPPRGHEQGEDGRGDAEDEDDPINEEVDEEYGPTDSDDAANRDPTDPTRREDDRP